MTALHGEQHLIDADQGGGVGGGDGDADADQGGDVGGGECDGDQGVGGGDKEKDGTE